MSDAASPLDGLVLPPDFATVVGADAARLGDVERFLAMLIAASGETNLVGAATLGAFWSRHFVDSAQLLWFSPRGRVWADLGAGAGLPGVVLAILLKGRPGARVHLVESRARRSAFLLEVTRALDLPAVVHAGRAESFSLDVEVVTARAFAPLDRLLAVAAPYLARGARGLFLKGEGVDAEIAKAHRRWRFDPRLETSLSDARGRVVAIDALAPGGGCAA